MEKGKKTFRNSAKSNENAKGAGKVYKKKGLVNAINTWDDLEHDAEDDFHDAREKFLMNRGKDVSVSEEEEGINYVCVRSDVSCCAFSLTTVTIEILKSTSAMRRFLRSMALKAMKRTKRLAKE